MQGDTIALTVGCTSLYVHTPHPLQGKRYEMRALILLQYPPLTGNRCMIRPHDLMTYPLPLIRRAVPSDLAAIVYIENASFVDPWDMSVFHEALACFPTTCFVAVCDGQVAGFIVSGLEDTGENIYGHICNLGVSPVYRQKGVGKLLVRRAEHQFALELATAVQLEVRVSNTAAQQFYRRLGYRHVFGIDRYYANGEDAFVMMKWFRL